MESRAKILDKLKKSIQEGSFYEAHQMYRTVYNRLSKQGKLAEALELVKSGADELFKAEQHGSGVDLSLLVLQLYNTIPVDFSLDSCLVLVQLLQRFPSNHPNRPDFIGGLLKWSAVRGPITSGDPVLHYTVAELYRKEKNFERALKHHLLGPSLESAMALAKMVNEWCFSEKGQDTDVSKATLIVFKLLASKRVKMAQLFLDAFVKESPKFTVATTFLVAEKHIPMVSDDTLSALVLFALVCQLNDAGGFKTLWERYETDLAKQCPEVPTLLAQIRTSIFGIRPQNNGQFDFNQLLSGLFGGGGGASQPALTSSQITELD